MVRPPASFMAKREVAKGLISGQMADSKRRDSQARAATVGSNCN